MHALTAVVIVDPHDAAAAARWDLPAVALTPRVSMLHVTHYWSAYWHSVRGTQALLDVPRGAPAVFPRERVLLDAVREVLGTEAPRWALIKTDYFGGAGEQWACAFEGEHRLTADDASINDALRALGIARGDGRDEFDTIGLGGHRRTPDDFRERYMELCEQRGV